MLTQLFLFHHIITSVVSQLCVCARVGVPAVLQVQLDALLGLSCLLSSGSTHEKLQLCFWALDR
jgi:hypothetical protein